MQVPDCDEDFCGTSGGQLKDFYWELPLEIDRNLDDVPSKSAPAAYRDIMRR